jgi:hypothetical protein
VAAGRAAARGRGGRDDVRARGLGGRAAAPDHPPRRPPGRRTLRGSARPPPDDDPKEQLTLALHGALDTVYGYSFILTDLEGEAAAVERHHRERAQIEERIKDQKLGVSLRRLPFSDLEANRVWVHASALALNLLCLLSDLLYGSDPPGHLPRRRQAKWLRRLLLCVPARVIHHARRIKLRLPAGLPSAGAFARAYTAARGLSPPAFAT